MGVERMVTVRAFLAGIMQGSLPGDAIHDQDYRKRIARALRAAFPSLEVVDPWALYPDSVGYDDARAREVFLRNIAEAARCDFLVAYLPEASMGTAVEMWAAYQAGKPVVTISPLKRNWVVRYLSSLVFPDLEAFEEAARDGRLARALRAAGREAT